MKVSFVSTRWEFLGPYIRDKVVLDIGPAELTGTINREKTAWALWPRVLEMARKATGLEKSMEQVQALVAQGYDVKQGDAEEFDLHEKFEVVLAGELIEHLSNPGQFLDCVKRHLEPDGVLLLTTPNRFDAGLFLSSLRRNFLPAYEKPLAKHVAYYDENSLLDLLRRHGFSNFQVCYYEWVGRSQPSKSLFIKAFQVWIRRYRIRFLPGLMVAAKI